MRFVRTFQRRALSDTLFSEREAYLNGVNLDKMDVLKVLERVNDPEFPVSVVELKVVTEKDIEVLPDKVVIEFTPTTPYCPMGGAIGVVIKYALEKELGLPVEVKVKQGTHIQEASLNEMLGDPEKYQETLKSFLESGLLDQCIVS